MTRNKNSVGVLVRLGNVADVSSQQSQTRPNGVFKPGTCCIQENVHCELIPVVRRKLLFGRGQGILQSHIQPEFVDFSSKLEVRKQTMCTHRWTFQTQECALMLPPMGNSRARNVTTAVLFITSDFIPSAAAGKCDSGRTTVACARHLFQQSLSTADTSRCPQLRRGSSAYWLHLERLQNESGESSRQNPAYQTVHIEPSSTSSPVVHTDTHRHYTTGSDCNQRARPPRRIRAETPHAALLKRLMSSRRVRFHKLPSNRR